MIGLVYGVGEIGSAYYSILSKRYPTYKFDIRPELCSPEIPETVDILHVCLRYSDEFEATVLAAIQKYRPQIVNIMTTCPPGTTERFGDIACQSTTRGLHPALKDYILATPKHVGGPRAAQLADYFRGAGIECVTHAKARTTEAAHLLSNCLYGANILFAREMESLCRTWGVDYYDVVMRYSETHNIGYQKMGMVSKFRPILHPPGPVISGHCVTNNARLVPQQMRGPIMAALADDGK